jgi:hypothetical protein
MVMDPPSHNPPDRPDKGERRPHDERPWSWLRVIVLLALAAGLGIWGYTLRPTAAKPLYVSEPKITILANQPDVTATVDMTLSSDLGRTTPYSLTLTLTPANPRQSVRFAVSFTGFPSGTGPNLRTSNGAYFTVINSAPRLSETVSQSPPWTFKASTPIGENVDGAQLRVAFPNLVGEKPGSLSLQACGYAASLVGSYSTICGQLGNQAEWTAPALVAGTTQFSPARPGLMDYQYLAGDDPTLLGATTWMWSGINGVTMLAASVPAQINEQNDLFYSGVLLGVAAGAAIASVTEFLRPAWRKGDDKSAANKPVE